MSSRRAFRALCWMAGFPVGLAVCLGVAWAGEVVDARGLLDYQGLLYLNDGSTSGSGTYDMEFRMFSDASAPAAGETPLWAEKQAGVDVTDGKFNVLLGDGSAFKDDTTTTTVNESLPHGSLADVFKSTPVYIQVTIGGKEIRVRQQFVSAPHAFHAENALTALHGMPTGTVMPFAGGAVPEGWLLCDGQYCSIDQYQDLYNAIWDTWGFMGLPPYTTFRVPDLRGRTPVGAGKGVDTNTAGDTPAGIVDRTTGTYFGEETHKLLISETPEHIHGYRDLGAKTTEPNLGVLPGGANDIPADDASNQENIPKFTEYAGGDQSHSNLQPSVAVNFIIKY